MGLGAATVVKAAWDVPHLTLPCAQTKHVSLALITVVEKTAVTMAEIETVTWKVKKLETLLILFCFYHSMRFLGNCRFHSLFIILDTHQWFIKGNRGKNDCFGNQPITDVHDCRNAAVELGMSFTQSGDWPSSPKGCLTSEWDGREIFFNENAIGSGHGDQAPICFKNGIFLT